MECRGQRRIPSEGPGPPGTTAKKKARPGSGQQRQRSSSTSSTEPLPPRPQKSSSGAQNSTAEAPNVVIRQRAAVGQTLGPPLRHKTIPRGRMWQAVSHQTALQRARLSSGSSALNALGGVGWSSEAPGPAEKPRQQETPRPKAPQPNQQRQAPRQAMNGGSCVLSTQGVVGWSSEAPGQAEKRRQQETPRPKAPQRNQQQQDPSPQVQQSALLLPEAGPPVVFRPLQGASAFRPADAKDEFGCAAV